MSKIRGEIQQDRQPSKSHICPRDRKADGGGYWGPQAGPSNPTPHLERFNTGELESGGVRRHTDRRACADERLVVAAVDLALRVEDATPVVGVEALLRVDVEQHLHVVPLLTRLEGEQLTRRLQLAGQRANKRRRRAPRAHELARLEVEGGAVQRAHDRVALDGALVERGADVRAHVGGGEDLAALVGGNEDVLARAEGGGQSRRLQVLGRADGRPDVLDGERATRHRHGTSAALRSERLASLEGNGTGEEERQHSPITVSSI